MAVLRTTSIQTFIALAADTKPTSGVPAGSRLWETDTGIWFQYDGSAWTVERPSGRSTLFDETADDTVAAIKTSAGTLWFLEVSNPTSADAFLQLFDLATGSVTLGTTAPKLSLFIPAGDGTKDGAMDKVFAVGIDFGTAIAYACTTTPSGLTAPATAQVLNVGYS